MPEIPITTILTTLPKLETTIPEIITTLPKIETTIPEIITTFPKLETTIPEIITTLPIIETTIPEIITTLPKIETTIPEIITTLPKIETTIPEIITTFPIIETTIPDILTTNPKIFTETYIPQDISSLVDFKTEQICEENKKFYNGSCICDIDKGYFSINYESIKEKCYKKHELPKNVYFNNFTKLYEFCYETCGTCDKGGNFTENNCLTCAANYKKYPNNNTDNCVEDCKFLYYYDSLKQYRCTDEEQCPQDARLIIREKEKCINKCSNDDTHTYQYNGECFTYCPIDTHPNIYNICQINDITNLPPAIIY